MGHVVILMQVGCASIDQNLGSDGNGCHPVAIRKEKYGDALKKLRASKMG